MLVGVDHAAAAEAVKTDPAGHAREQDEKLAEHEHHVVDAAIVDDAAGGHAAQKRIPVKC